MERKLSVVGNRRTVSNEDSSFKPWKHWKLSSLINFKDYSSFHRHLLPVDREGSASWAVTRLGTCVALRCWHCFIGTVCACWASGTAVTHALTDALGEKCSAWQAYLSVDGAQDRELCALLSVPQITTVLVLQPLFLAVQPVMHIFRDFLGQSVLVCSL